MLDEATLQETLKRYPKEISKEQLCKLCHISKRAAKYYLDNGVIPCRCNGLPPTSTPSTPGMPSLSCADGMRARTPSASLYVTARPGRLSTPPSTTRNG